MKIQTNEKGTRFIEVSETNLETLRKYNLLDGLTDSNGIVDENTLERLRMQAKALLEHVEADSDLLDVCKEVLFHDNMKAYGLQNLLNAYRDNA